MRRGSFLKLCIATFLLLASSLWSSTELHLSPNDTLETHGISVLLFHNQYHKVFGDQKMSGLEIILHDQRIATNGDVRLSATPSQWDPIPDVEARKRGASADEVAACCRNPDRGLKYRIDVRPESEGFRITVQLDSPIPSDLVGKAGFNLEFVPDLYFGKSFVAGGMTGIFPRHSGGPMERTDGGVEPLPLAKGDSIVLSPEDPLTRVSINSESGPILLFDGRTQAQNGWFIVRTLLPAGKTGDVVVWHVKLNVVPGWSRRPVIGYNRSATRLIAKRSQSSNWIRFLMRPKPLACCS